jgi:plasmid stabilization system protein ParE
MATKYRVEYISTFHVDVLAVTAFLEGYSKKAARIFAKVDQALWHLKKMPEMYPVYQNVPSYRFITIEDYLVLYKVNKQDEVVEVHRLLNSRMDIPTHIHDKKMEP